MKILLIYPNPGLEYDSLGRHPCIAGIARKLAKVIWWRFPGNGGSLIPPLALITLAAQTPQHHEVILVDERLEEIDFNVKVDLVGISVMTISAKRAYKIADQFKERGIPVILGGIHPSLLPKEASQHSTSIVIGEAEGIWHKVLEDCEEGRLGKIYKSHKYPDLRNLPIPRFDLLKRSGYITHNIIEIGRGCPYNCSFCSATTFFGNKYRYRPIEDIVKEIKIRKLVNKFVIFTSDNIFSNKQYARELFTALIPYNIHWMGNSSIQIARDRELLKLASRSGCRSLLLGFESLSEHTLKNINKGHNSNPEHYSSLIEAIHNEGIGITGNFIVGLDGDDTTVFNQISDFVIKEKIEAPQVCILVPFPGTKLFYEFEKDDRILTKDWDLYYNTIGNIVYEPKGMTIKELRRGYCTTFMKMYSTRAIIKRLFPTRNFLGFYLPYNIGHKWKTRWLRKNVLSNIDHLTTSVRN